MKEEILKRWLEVSKYPGDHNGPKIGCCGGDYCDDPIQRDHNLDTADWWLKEIDSLLQGIIGDIEGKMASDEHNKDCGSRINGNGCDCTEFERTCFNQGIFDSIEIIKSKLK